MKKATMVLEGGAVRGVFTSGALDYLMEQDFYTSHVIGVSAGSCNGADYVSRQIGRTRDCMIQKEKEYGYINVRKFLKEKSLLDMDLIFDRFPNEIYPFDYDTYFKSDMTFEIVVTNCETGQAEYLTEKSDKERLMKACRASSSMPLLSPIVNIDGVPYLDGGIADSVPLKRAIKLGNKKIIIILTKGPGYRKKLPSKAKVRLYKSAYKKYPEFVRTMLRRPLVYNRMMERIERLEAEGKIFVLRPKLTMISRLEQNAEKMEAFYNHGYECMKEEYPALLEFLSRKQE